MIKPRSAMNAPIRKPDAKDANYKRHVDWVVAWFSRLPRGTVLDIGSGDGLISSMLNHIGFKVKGVEVNPLAIKIARAKVPGIEFVAGDYLAQDFKADYVLASSVLEFFTLGVGAANFLAKAWRETGRAMLVSVKDRLTPPANPLGFLEFDKNEVMEMGQDLIGIPSDIGATIKVDQVGAFIYLQMERANAGK